MSFWKNPFKDIVKTVTNVANSATGIVGGVVGTVVNPLLSSGLGQAALGVVSGGSSGVIGSVLSGITGGLKPTTNTATTVPNGFVAGSSPTVPTSSADDYIKYAAVGLGFFVVLKLLKIIK